MSARNGSNHFMNGISGQQVPLQEVPLNENLQKSGDNTKLDRHGSFALYGKRNTTLNGTKSGN